MAWYWIVLIVYVCVCVVISFLGIFLKPLRYVVKILITSWKYLIEFVYIVLVWWWLAILRLIRKKPAPKVWIFRKA